MARGVNKVILIGNLGDEPLSRTTHSGSSVTNISMVTNEVRRNMDTGENVEYAEWHRVVMWGKLADIAKQYLHKGSQVYIEGKLRTRTFVDKQNQKRSVTEIVADELQMLGTRSQNSNNALPQGNNYRRQNPSFNQNSYAQNSYAGGYGQNVTTNAYASAQQDDYAQDINYAQDDYPVDDMDQIPDVHQGEQMNQSANNPQMQKSVEPSVKISDDIPF